MKIFLKVKLKARKNEVKKIDDEHYEILTTLVPENGKVNQEIINLLAKYFRIGKKRVRILKGLFCREKVVEIDNEKY